MRARGMMTVAIVAAVGASCSSESSPAGEAAAATGQPRTLALPDGTAEGDAVVSDLESGTAPEIAPVRSAASFRNEAQPELRAKQQAGAAPAIPDVNVFVVSSTRAPLAAPEITVERPQPAEAVAAAESEADEPSSAAGHGDHNRPGRGVIIRGGVTEGDDCKLHMPPRGGMGVSLPAAGELINRRGPRLGLPPIRGGGIR